MKGVVGIIGLGIMGGAMAKNLVSAGWQVIGYDIDAERCSELASAGVKIAASIGDVAKSARTIISSLPHPAAAHDMARAIASSNSSPCVIIETSTLAIDDKLGVEAVLLQAGHKTIDCPISGTGAQARTKDIVLYASGDADIIAGLQPLFADFSREAHCVGAFGNGSRMKYVANLLVAIHNVASAEAMVLGMKSGLDPHQVVKLILAGVGTSRVFELRAPMMADNHYNEATMKVSTWQKDMSVIGQFASSLGCPTPLFSATIPIYNSAMANGLGPADTAAVCSVLETMAALERKPMSGQ